MNSLIFSKKTKQIINHLIKGDKSLTDLANIISVSKPTILKNLDVLEEIGLIHSKIKITNIGREKRYYISAFSQVLRIDRSKGIISYTINEPFNFKFPMVGQIQQQKFRKAINIYLEKILAKYNLRFSLIVYGSIARGEATAKSDLDLMLLSLKKWNNKSKNKIMDALYEGAIDSQLQAKPLFRTLNEFVKSDDSITSRIKKEGIIIIDLLDSDELWKTMQMYWNITS